MVAENGYIKKRSVHTQTTHISQHTNRWYIYIFHTNKKKYKTIKLRTLFACIFHDSSHTHHRRISVTVVSVVSVASCVRVWEGLREGVANGVY